VSTLVCPVCLCVNCDVGLVFVLMIVGGCDVGGLVGGFPQHPRQRQITRTMVHLQVKTHKVYEVSNCSDGRVVCFVFVRGVDLSYFSVCCGVLV
jgi:hypothetical protein